MKVLFKKLFLSTSLLGLLALPALAECPRGDLDKRYCDRNGDLVADAPTDSSKWVDPDTLIFAYTPVEDPAVYKEAWSDFLDHMGGCDSAIGRTDTEEFREKQEMEFRAKPAAVVRSALNSGSLNLIEDCARAGSVSGGGFKFTVTSPYMLSRTLLDNHYKDFDALTLAIADVLAEQVKDCPCECLQVDEANIPGSPEHGPLAAEAINRVLDAFNGKTAVHFCFGNYGGQVIQAGTWSSLVGFLNDLQADHLVLELAHRPDDDLAALREIDPRLNIGIGVIDIKVNQVETAEEVAARIEKAAGVLGGDRIRFVHPDCGFWMLKRSVSDRKIAALAKGRDLFLGI